MTLSLGHEEALGLHDSHHKKANQNNESDPYPRGKTFDQIFIAICFLHVVVRDSVNIEINRKDGKVWVIYAQEEINDYPKYANNLKNGANIPVF